MRTFAMSAILPPLKIRSMTDVHDKKTRSFNMSMIKGKDTKPEIIVRKLLSKNGYRYSLNSSKFSFNAEVL